MTMHPGVADGEPIQSEMRSPQGPLRLLLGTHAALSRNYLPFLKSGGFFVPDASASRLGEPCTLWLQLPDSPYPATVETRVVGIFPDTVAEPWRSGLWLALAGVDADRWRNRIDALLRT